MTAAGTDTERQSLEDVADRYGAAAASLVAMQLEHPRHRDAEA
jgi:hypothetical protein